MEPLGPLPRGILDINEAAADFYTRTVYQPPWVGYLAVVGATAVGSAGFVAPPDENRVEIFAWPTSAGAPGAGLCDADTAALVAIARAAEPQIEIYAKTLPEDGPRPRSSRGSVSAASARPSITRSAWRGPGC